MKPAAQRSFWPVHINCDCASYDWARRRPLRSGEWMRCLYCHRRLGDMEITHYPKVRARTTGEAWAIAKDSLKKHKEEQ